MIPENPYITITSPIDLISNIIITTETDTKQKQDNNIINNKTSINGNKKYYDDRHEHSLTHMQTIEIANGYHDILKSNFPPRKFPQPITSPPLASTPKRGKGSILGVPKESLFLFRVGDVVFIFWLGVKVSVEEGFGTAPVGVVRWLNC